MLFGALICAAASCCFAWQSVIAFARLASLEVRERFPSSAASTNHRWLPPLMVGLVALVNFVIGYFVHPSLLRYPSPYAEAATVYALPLYQYSPLDFLMMPEAGYLVFGLKVPMLIARLFGLPIECVHYFLAWQSYLVSTACTAGFCFRKYRSVIASDLARAFFGCVVLISMPYEVRTLINCLYFVCLPALYISSYYFVSGDKRVSIGLCLIPIGLFSKPLLLSLLPVLMLMVIFAPSRSTRLMFGASALALLTQMAFVVFTLLTNPVIRPGAAPEGTTAALRLLEAFVLPAASFWNSLLPQRLWNALGTDRLLVWTLIGTWVVTCWAFVRFLRSKNQFLVIGWMSLLTLVASGFLLSQSIPEYWNVRNLALPIVPARHTAIVLCCALLCGLSGTAALRAGYRWVVLLIWTIASPFPGWAESSLAPLGFPVVGSNYFGEVIGQFGKVKSLCLPLDPYHWHAGPGCEKVSAPSPASSRFVPVRDRTQIIEIPEKMIGRYPRAVTVVISSEGCDVVTVRLKDERETLLSRNRQKICKAPRLIFLPIAEDVSPLSAGNLELRFSREVSILMDEDTGGKFPAVVFFADDYR